MNKNDMDEMISKSQLLEALDKAGHDWGFDSSIRKGIELAMDEVNEMPVVRKRQPFDKRFSHFYMVEDGKIKKCSDKENRYLSFYCDMSFDLNDDIFTVKSEYKYFWLFEFTDKLLEKMDPHYARFLEMYYGLHFTNVESRSAIEKYIQESKNFDREKWLSSGRSSLIDYYKMNCSSLVKDQLLQAGEYEKDVKRFTCCNKDIRACDIWKDNETPAHITFLCNQSDMILFRDQIKEEIRSEFEYILLREDDIPSRYHFDNIRLKSIQYSGSFQINDLPIYDHEKSFIHKECGGNRVRSIISKLDALMEEYDYTVSSTIFNLFKDFKNGILADDKNTIVTFETYNGVVKIEIKDTSIYGSMEEQIATYFESRKCALYCDDSFPISDQFCDYLLQMGYFFTDEVLENIDYIRSNPFPYIYSGFDEYNYVTCQDKIMMVKGKDADIEALDFLAEKGLENSNVPIVNRQVNRFLKIYMKSRELRNTPKSFLPHILRGVGTIKDDATRCPDDNEFLTQRETYLYYQRDKRNYKIEAEVYYCSKCKRKYVKKKELEKAVMEGTPVLL